MTQQRPARLFAPYPRAIQRFTATCDHPTQIDVTTLNALHTSRHCPACGAWF